MDSQTDRKELSEQVTQVILIAETLLHNQILGIYLYGSATMNGLRPDSDIDILIITNQEMSLAVRKDLTEQLLSASGSVGCTGKRPLEVTVINRCDITPWKFPPKCEYMYGEWLRSEIESGKIPQSCNDPDVAVLLWQTRSHSITLRGMDAEKLIPSIPFTEIRKAMEDSLSGLIASIKGDERNVLLTLARMWFTLETGGICTKDIAAKWVCPKLPESLRSLMKMAGDAYCGKISDQWDNAENEILLLTNFLSQQLEEGFRCFPTRSLTAKPGGAVNGGHT